MQSVEKLFAVVDRKLDAFDFAIKKVKGKKTGNEYYAVSMVCILNGEKFEKRVLTIGCPKKAIDAIAKAILAKFGVVLTVSAGQVTVRKEVQQVAKVTLSPVGDTPGKVTLRKIDPQPVRPVQEDLIEIDEDDYDPFEDDDDDEEYADDEEEYDEDEYEDDEPSEVSPSSVTLTRHTDAPAAAPVSSAHNCPYCNNKVAPNFAFCPNCGGQQ